MGSKFVWTGGLTAIQSLLVYIVFTAIGTFSTPTPGVWGWQVLELVLLAFAITGIGLPVLGFAKSAAESTSHAPLVVVATPVFRLDSPI